MKAIANITKRLIPVFALGVLLAFGLAGCADLTSEEAANPSTETTVATQEQSGASPTESETSTEQNTPSASEGNATQADGGATTPNGASNANDGMGRVLVAYYSGMGHTARVAQDIATDTDGALFEIIPAEPYSTEDLNFNNPDSRISHEHNDESLRDIPLATTEVPDWSSYDTVFIGYPIWWGNPAWVMYHFVSDNDFTGKTVIPFCTSESSGIGSTAETLHAMTNTGNWEEGHRFDEDATAEDVAQWVESLR